MRNCAQMYYGFLSKGRRKNREGLTSLSDCVIMNYKKDKKGWHEQFRMMRQKRKILEENTEEADDLADEIRELIELEG